MSENYRIKMENIIGDYYLCLGAFKNCIELYNKRDSFKINDNDSIEIKKIKQAQMNDLMSNLGKVGEKALKYIIALQKVKVAPNEDLKSLEALYRGDNAMKYFVKQLGFCLDSSDIQEIFDYKDYNNQKSHNFDFLFLIIERLIPDQFNKFKNYILYDIQSKLMNEAIINGEVDASFSFVKAIILPKFAIEVGFTYDDDEELPNRRKMNKKEYDIYRKIIKQSGDIFTRLRYYSNDPKDREFNLDDIFKTINYFIQYIEIIHDNGDNLDFNLEEYFALLQSFKHASLLYLSNDDIINIFNLNIDLRIKEKLLFQEKAYRDLDENPYTYKMVQNLIQLKLSSDYIYKIINYNLAPRFVEFCLSNGIDDIDEMDYLYNQYINGENIKSLIRKISL